MYILFSKFLNELPEDSFDDERIFILKSFTYWNQEKIDVKLVFKYEKGNYILVYKIPFTAQKEKIFSEKNKNELLKSIYHSGLDILKETLKKQNIIYNVENEITHSIMDTEYETYSFFWPKDYGQSSRLEVWTYEKNKYEVFSRVGKDNLIYSKKYLKNVIVNVRSVIKDGYLESLIPKEETISEEDYGYIPSSQESITVKAYLNEKLTEKFRKEYDDENHYIHLYHNMGRKEHLKDDKEYKKILNNE